MRLLLPLLLLGLSLAVSGELPKFLERLSPLSIMERDKREPSVYDDESSNRTKRLELSYNEWEDLAASEVENRLKREEKDKKKKEEEPEEENPAEEGDEEETGKKKGKMSRFLGWAKKGVKKFTSGAKAVFSGAKTGAKMVVGGLRSAGKWAKEKATGKKKEEEEEE